MESSGFWNYWNYTLAFLILPLSLPQRYAVTNRNIETVFLDVNNTSSILLPSAPGSRSSRTANLTALECHDSSTGLTLLVQLIAPANHWSLTTLSTLQVAMVESSGSEEEEATQQLLNTSATCLAYAFSFNSTKYEIGTTDAYR
jgi:hypothetical protein